jgi:hypothetical protein
LVSGLTGIVHLLTKVYDICHEITRLFAADSRLK